MSNPNAAIYPAAAAADTDLFVCADNAVTALAAVVLIGATSISLASTTHFRAPCILRIEAEIILCPTDPVAGVFSGVTRGAQGSAADAHAAATTVYGFYFAWHHNQLAAEIKAIETQLIASGLSAIHFADNETPAGLKNGVNTAFTLAHSPAPTAGLQLYRNGILQQQGAGKDYTLAGAAITALSIPETGDVLIAYYRY